MVLYHYTAPVTSHLGSILQDGQIDTSISNVDIHQPGREELKVVWLSDSTDPDAQQWGIEKTGAVLVVDLPEESVFHWPSWSRKQGIDPDIYDALAETGGDPESWWVTTQPIPRQNIIALIIFAMSEKVQARVFEGEDLRRLFKSTEARQSLTLPKSKKRANP